MRTIDKSMSNKDKSLLVFLLVILIFFLAYYFYISPQLDIYLAARSELQTASQELANLDSEIASLADLQNQKEERIALINEKIKPFFYELKDDRLLNQFNIMMDQNNLNMKSYSVNRPTVTTIVPNTTPELSLDYPILGSAAKINQDIILPDQDEVQNDTGSSEATTKDDALVAYGLTLTFADTKYNSLTGFLKSVEAMDKAIVVSSINLGTNTDQTSGTILLQGNIQYTLYSLAKPDNSEKDYLAFTLLQPKGKADPFN